VFFLVSDSLLSTIEGDFEPARLRDFPTAKNAGEEPGVGPVVPRGGAGPEDELESFSRAFILCEMPDPRFTFLTTGRVVG
jgi:hypothetical protein